MADRDPGALLDEVRSFARRKPGTYLAIALGAGVLAGRLTRGLTAPTDDTPTPRQHNHVHSDVDGHVDRAAEPRTDPVRRQRTGQQPPRVHPTRIGSTRCRKPPHPWAVSARPVHSVIHEVR